MGEFILNSSLVAIVIGVLLITTDSLYLKNSISKKTKFK